MGYEDIGSITRVKLDYIQDFEMMFGRMGIERPREAATYYIILVVDNPKEFSEFLKISERLVGIARRPLEAGRNSLFKNGLIAKVLFSESEENFGRERYLPVNPKVIWEETKEDLKPIVSREAFEIIQNNVGNLSELYHENFKVHGIKLCRGGKVTLRYSNKWIYYTLLSNCLEKSSHLRLQLSGENFSNSQLLRYVRRLLELNKKIQLLVNDEESVENIRKLKEEFGGKLDVRMFPSELSGLMKNYVFGKELAVVSMKILSDEDAEPSYVATAYVDLNDVERLSKDFDTMWNLGRPI